MAESQQPSIMESMTLDSLALLRRNLDSIETRIQDACHRAGRQRDDVHLIAVTKYVGLDATVGLAQAGCHDLGESRPQVLWSKAESWPVAAAPPVRWHLIGHLQRNKVRRTLPLVHRLHSIDSERLLDALEQEAASANLHVHGLLELNVSQDATKTGLLPEFAPALLQQRDRWPHIQLVGLMGMAPLEGDLTAAQQSFATLRQWRDRLSRDSGLPLPELSMGMSGDFEAAIAEGATWIRIGSLLFEGLDSI